MALTERVLLQTTVLIAICAIASGQDPVEPVRQFAQQESTRGKLDKTFNAELTKLKEEYRDVAQPILALLTELRIQHDPSREYLIVSPAILPTAVTDRDKLCLTAISTLQRQYAQRLFKLAESYVHEQNGNRAFRLLHEVTLHDSEHKSAKTITRNVVYANGEVTAKKGRTAQPKYGWSPGAYFLVKSPNYFIVSNASEEDSVKLAENLELLNSAWRQVFFEYWSKPNELSQALTRRMPLRIPKPNHRVVLFVNREEYIAAIERIEPRARMTLGYYNAANETAYFYIKPPGESDATWKHEATHQLFNEVRRVRPDLGNDANFWMVEGLALYMESLQIRPGYSFVGGLEADRLQFARYRRLCEDYYVPLAELTAMDKDELQRHPEIRRIYSQAAGLTHFFMRTQREAFLRYVDSVYAGRDSAETLASEARESFEHLDSAYRQFLNVDDTQLDAIDSRATIANLSLGCTQVTDAGVVGLNLRAVRWFDLSATRISDAGTARLSEAADLRQLSLYGTAISDKTIDRLANASYLEELDLSKTRVTNESVPQLLRLPKLTSLEVNGTKISADQLQRLRDRIPATD